MANAPDRAFLIERVTDLWVGFPRVPYLDLIEMVLLIHARFRQKGIPLKGAPRLKAHVMHQEMEIIWDEQNELEAELQEEANRKRRRGRPRPTPESLLIAAKRSATNDTHFCSLKEARKATAAFLEVFKSTKRTPSVDKVYQAERRIAKLLASQTRTAWTQANLYPIVLNFLEAMIAWDKGLPVARLKIMRRGAELMRICDELDEQFEESRRAKSAKTDKSAAGGMRR